QECLETRGEGIHHNAFQVDGMDKHITLLESKGARLQPRGDFTGGSYAYIDAQKQLGLILELLASTDYALCAKANMFCSADPAVCSSVPVGLCPTPSRGPPSSPASVFSPV